ncbi:hypothetical protein E2562_017805, partial [Oryza meyeriana var. granulata]
DARVGSDYGGRRPSTSSTRRRRWWGCGEWWLKHAGRWSSWVRGEGRRNRAVTDGLGEGQRASDGDGLRLRGKAAEYLLNVAEAVVGIGARRS